MTQVNQNWTTYQGDSERLTFYITQSAAALDLSGGVFKWALARTLPAAETSDTILVKYSPSSGIAISSATGGLVIVSINSGEIIQTGNFYHYLQMTLGGVIDTVSVGRVTVNPSAAYA